MKLVLKVSGETATAPGGRASHTFDQFGGTVGRGEDNTWILPDPNRSLSRRHFVIDFDGAAFWITDLSSNGVFLNHSPERLTRGRRVRLNDGDHLKVGDYDIDAWLESGAGTVRDSSDTFSSVLMATPGAGKAGTMDDIDSLLDGIAPPGVGPLAHHTAFPPAPPPAPPSIANPFANPFEDCADDSLFGPPRPLAPAPQAVSFPDHVPAEQGFLRPPVAHPTIPDGWSPADTPGQAATGAFPATAAPTNRLPDDWDDGIADLIGRPVAPVQGAPTAAPPPAPAPATPSPQPAAAPTAAAVAPSEDVDRAWRLFLEGAGLDPTLVATASPEDAVKTAGALFRIAIAGLRELLVARSAMKNELRVDQTMVQAAGNNPLKFFATADEVLGVLLARPRPGYMPGPAAVQEAIRDIKTHEMALLSGLRESMEATLASLEPTAIEGRAATSGSLSGIIPATRKAKLWDAYVHFYAQTVDQFRGEAGAAMGKDFATGYRRQVGKMNGD